MSYGRKASSHRKKKLPLAKTQLFRLTIFEILHALVLCRVGHEVSKLVKYTCIAKDMAAMSAQYITL